MHSRSLLRNWSDGKRAFVGSLIGLLTFCVYIGSAIYTPSIPGLMEDLGASQVLATAGLSLFVCFYGIGPSKLYILLYDELAEPSKQLLTFPFALFSFLFSVTVLLAPMQEVPSIGRNPVYIAGMFLYVIFQIPPLFANGMAVILVFRAAAGFVGSPALATGGASIGDLYMGPYYAVALVSRFSLVSVFGR